MSAHACGATSCAPTGCTPAASMSASAAAATAARPMAITLVAASVGSVRGGRIGDFDDHPPLDTVVPAVGDVQIALAIDHHAVVVEELTGGAPVQDAALAWC